MSLSPTVDIPEAADIDRLLFLYSESNAEERETLLFWRRSLRAYGAQRSTSAVDLAQATQAFVLHGVYPSSLPLVVDTLVRDNVLLRESALPVLSLCDSAESCGSASHTHTDTHTRSQGEREEESVSLVTSLFSAVLSVSGSLLGSLTSVSSAANTHTHTHTHSEKLYLAETLAEMERTLLTHAKSREESELVLFVSSSLPDFPHCFTRLLCEAVRDSPALRTLAESREERETLLRYMVFRKSAVVKGNIVQIVRASSVPSQPFSFYASLLNVRVSTHQIQSKVKELERKMNHHKQEAIRAKMSGNESAALLQLKIRKLVEEQMRKLIAAQHSLEHSLLNMESAVMNMNIINAYKAAAEGLRVSREEGGVSVESVEDAVENFQAEMDEMRDINDALVAPSALTSSEEMDLEAELEALMNAPAAQPELTTLPSVPSRLPERETPTMNQKKAKESLLASI